MSSNKIKVILLGTSNVGKTTIFNRLLNNMSEDFQTIGVAFSEFVYEGVRFNMWDTAGQERYMSLCELYYRGAHIVILVFDLSDLESSIDQIIRLKREINIKNPKSKFLIVGNKADLVNLDLVRPLVVRYISDVAIIYMCANQDAHIKNLKNNLLLVADEVIKLHTLDKIELDAINVKKSCHC